jgi:hypothetical protein
LLWYPRYPDVNVTSGTAIRFMWRNAQGVYRLPDRICPPLDSNFTGPGITELAPVTNGGQYSTPPLSSGDYYFASPVWFIQGNSPVGKSLLQ